MWHRKLKFLGIIALLCVTRLSAHTEDPEVLRFGIISTESTSGLRRDFSPFLEALEAKLGLPVKAYFASDYAGVIEAMRFGKVDVAWMGNKAAIEAVDRANAEVFAQTTALDGSHDYRSVIIVHKDSRFQTLEEVLKQANELTFGNGDPQSTSGNLVPQYYLWSPMGIQPAQLFKQVRRANHETNAIAVATKQIDLATCNDEALERLERNHPKFAEQLRVIWTSPPIPSDPLVYRKSLSRELRSHIAAAILAFGRLGANVERERELLSHINEGWGPFLISDNSQLLPLRGIELENQRLILENKEGVDAKDKASRLQAIEQEIEQLKAFEQLQMQYHGDGNRQ